MAEEYIPQDKPFPTREELDKLLNNGGGGC